MIAFIGKDINGYAYIIERLSVTDDVLSESLEY